MCLDVASIRIPYQVAEARDVTRQHLCSLVDHRLHTHCPVLTFTERPCGRACSLSVESSHIEQENPLRLQCFVHPGKQLQTRGGPIPVIEVVVQHLPDRGDSNTVRNLSRDERLAMEL